MDLRKTNSDDTTYGIAISQARNLGLPRNIIAFPDSLLLKKSKLRKLSNMCSDVETALKRKVVAILLTMLCLKAFQLCDLKGAFLLDSAKTTPVARRIRPSMRKTSVY